MAAFIPARMRRGAMLAAALVVVIAGPAWPQILPWEIVVAEIEAGRLRNFTQRLNKQYLLYQLRLGNVSKADLSATAGQIDRILESLTQGSPSHSIPAPWTPALREQVEAVEGIWAPIRRVAVASPYEHIRVIQEFSVPRSSRGDPLLLRYFDDLSLEQVAASDALLATYHEECVQTGLAVCATARTSGYAAMVIEQAAKEAVYIVAGISPDESRQRLTTSIAAYRELRAENDANPFFAAALDPERGISAQAAGQLLISLREDWDAMQGELDILAAGDEANFDLQRLLAIQDRLVAKVERLSAALIRYASLTYGG
jgi:hypothetical protein